MRTSVRVLVPLVAALAGLAPAVVVAADHGPAPVPAVTTFAVIGDTPYSALQLANFPYMVDQINADPDVDWVAHLGDIKSGSSVCSDEYFATVRSQFDRFVDPLVYTPGDNEWTDCHRTNNGAYDPLERLDAVREVFFPVRDRTLGQTPMRVDSQWRIGLEENVRFSDSDAVYAAAHVVGSNNGLAPWTGRTAPTFQQTVEVTVRSVADLALIKTAFLQAKLERDPLVVLMIQADMFDPTVVSPVLADYSAFQPIVQLIAHEAAGFKGKVLLLDGDSHGFVVDNPLSTGSKWLSFYGVRKAVSNLTRITVEGSTGVDEWLKISVDETATAGFTYERVPFAPSPVTHVKINEVESQGGVPGDWIELVNRSTVALDVSGYVLKDDDDTHIGTIPSGSVIPANGYLVIDESVLGYGLGGSDQARLFARDGVTLLDSTTWPAHAASTWGRCPDGTGSFGVTSAVTKGAVNNCAPLVVLNEIESSGGTPGDWVELYNPGPSASDVSGWVLRDSNDASVYVLPAGTVVPSGGYLVLDEAQFGFGLGGADSARLFRADGTLHDSYTWTAHAAVTYGRCPNGVGAFGPTLAASKGAANICAAPVTSIVINEVESNGGTPGDWVELKNTGATAVDIGGWTFVDGDPTHTPYAFPSGSVIAPGGYFLVEEAQFGFGLGSADSANFTSPGGQVVSHSWTAHALVSWGRCPDGTGAFGDTIASTKGAANACGSPVVINEVESSGGTPGDWVEFYNPSGTAADISGFTFRDSNDAAGFVLPVGTTVPALGFLVLDEATFGFGLGSADSARLFGLDGTTLVSSYAWTAHATSTYGRCPDGVGAFETSVAATKGSQNHCAGIPFFGPWPGGTTVAAVDDTATFTTNLSGLDYEASGTAAPGTLWAVQNGPGTLYKLTWNGTTWAPDAAGGWATGAALRYPDGTGDVDSEGVILAAGTGTVYVGSERNNAASSVSRNAVLQFDTPAGAGTLTAVREWNLTGDLPVTGANTGIEAVSWVPDSFLVSSGFIDQTTGAAYDPASYPNHGDGLFFVAVEATGGIYAYELDHSDGTFTRLATIAGGFPGVMALEFDAELGDLWAVCDDTCQGRSSVLRIDATGAFAVVASYNRPTDMSNLNNEGFVITPLAECSAGVRPVFYSDDSDTGGNSLRRATLTCP